MELKGHFQHTLLLMLLMTLASYAWQSSNDCPEQGLPAGGACSRFEKYCPAGTVCEELDHIYACRIPAGESGCGTDNDKCVTNAICVSDICEYGPEGTVSSPNYPSDYPGNVHEVWTITAPEGHVVQLTFLVFDVEHRISGPDALNYLDCPYDYLKLLDGIDADAPQFLMICGQGNPAPVTSPGNVLQMVFKTDSSVQFGGFQIEYRVVPKDP